MRYFSVIVFCAICGLGSGVRAFAGELSPPAGPVQDTDATLLNTQWTTLPYSITQSGTYRLTSDLTGVAGQNGIMVRSDDVTIDLNGFSLVGVPGSQRAVTTDVGSIYRGVTVQNGFVHDWGTGGVDGNFLDFGTFQFAVLQDLTVRGVTVRQCGGASIRGGNNARILDCVVRDGVIGIFVFTNGVISGCAVINCTNVGIALGNSGGVIRDCAVKNGGIGISIIEGSLVQGCTISNTTGVGISTSNSNSTILECTLENVGGVGISRLSQSLVERCSISGSGSHGISVSFQSTIRGCVITSSGGDGIFGNSVGPSGDSLIVDNLIQRSSGFGINCPNNTGNHIYRNLIKLNTGGVMNVPGSDAPLSASSAGASPWSNIGS